MTKNELENGYNGIFAYDGYELAAQTLLYLDLLDGKGKERARLFHFWDKQADQESDFYYNMLECTKFINPAEGIAYTTPNKIISMGYPQDAIPDDSDEFKRWYFIYCHECLHQLWDTFGAEEKVKAANGYCDHEIMNQASDCIINEFLKTVEKRFKTPPSIGIFKENIKETYGVEYDPRRDTLVSLYNKIMALKPEQQQKGKDQLNKSKNWGDTIDPGEVRVREGPTPPPPTPGAKQPKPTAALKAGWEQAVKDVLSILKADTEGISNTMKDDSASNKPDLSKWVGQKIKELRSRVKSGEVLSVQNDTNNAPEMDCKQRAKEILDMLQRKYGGSN